jgi:hypothetical protein
MRIVVAIVPATFLIDTGAERSIIDSAFARRLGVRRLGLMFPL